MLLLRRLALAAALLFQSGIAGAQVCQDYQLEDYKQKYGSAEQCWKGEQGMRGATRACCEQALGEPANGKPLSGTCECNVYIDPPEYCPKYGNDGPARKACGQRNQSWLDRCNEWLKTACKP